MPNDPKSELQRILTEGVRAIAPQLGEFTVTLEKPRRPEHGDWSSTAALQIAKALGMPSREVAEALRNATAQRTLKSAKNLCHRTQLHICI